MHVCMCVIFKELALLLFMDKRKTRLKTIFNYPKLSKTTQNCPKLSVTANWLRMCQIDTWIDIC